MTLLPVTHIQRKIYFIRDQKVMLDHDLADLYGVTTKRLNEQVKRNQERFPKTFMFQLTQEETDHFLRSQNATSIPSRGGRRYRHFVFTEHGAIMLATVLKSRTAIRASVAVVEAFVQLREMLATHRDLARKLEELEGKYDAQFKVVFDAIRELMSPAAAKPAIHIKGFRKE